MRGKQVAQNLPLKLLNAFSIVFVVANPLLWRLLDPDLVKPRFHLHIGWVMPALSSAVACTTALMWPDELQEKPVGTVRDGTSSRSILSIQSPRRFLSLSTFLTWLIMSSALWKLIFSRRATSIPAATGARVTPEMQWT